MTGGTDVFNTVETLVQHHVPSMDREIAALQVLQVLFPLFDNDEQQRLLDWLCSRYPRVQVQVQGGPPSAG